MKAALCGLSSPPSGTRTMSPIPDAPLAEREALQLLDHLPAIVGLKQAASALGLSTATLRRRVVTGELRRLRSRDKRGGRVLFAKLDLAKLLSEMSR